MKSLELIGGIVLFIGLLIGGMAGLSLIVWSLIWPIERRAQATQGKFRFRLIDLGCLLVFWQVIFAAITTVRRDDVELMLLALALFGVPACGVVALVWGICVSVLSRAGIQSSARRAAFMLITIPGTLVAAVSFVVSGAVAAFVGVWWLTEPAAGNFDYLPAAIFLGTCGAIGMLRLVSLWIAADAAAP